MHIPTLTTTLIALLTIQTSAVKVVLHSLNHCSTSSVDLQCGNLAKGSCCTRSGLSARSVSFHGASGDSCHVNNGGGCKKNVFSHRATSGNYCIFHTSANGVYSGALYKDPLKKRDECVEGSGCVAVEPDQAVVNGETTVDISGMSEGALSELYALAGNGTGVGEWPEALTKLIVPTEVFGTAEYVSSD